MNPRDNSKDRANATGVAPLSRRSGSGLDQTLPFGTPRPAPVQPGAIFDPPVPPASAPVSDRIPDTLTLRGSFVRVVGPPTVPPPRRGRGSGGGWEPALSAPVSERLAFEQSLPADADQHEAFVLDRPVSSAGDAFATRSTTESVVVSRAWWPAVEQGGSVILPPPPGAGDYEPASGPDSALPSAPTPPAPVVSQAGAVVSPPVATPRVAPRPATLEELPTVNPFAGFEAQREGWGRRSVFVFTLALALVGLCALVAIALGFLGKRW